MKGANPHFLFTMINYLKLENIMSDKKSMDIKDKGIKDRNARGNNARGNNARDNNTRGSAKDKNVRGRGVNDNNIKNINVNDRNVKDKNIKGRNASDRSAKDRNIKDVSINDGRIYDNKKKLNSIKKGKKKVTIMEDGTKKVLKRKKRKKKMSFWKKLGIFFLVLFGIFATICLVLGFKYGPTILKYREEADKMVEEGGEAAFKSALTSTVYGSDGQVIFELSSNKSSYYLPNKKIPYLVKRAFIITEDRSFYDHPGVDVKAVMRAVVAYVQNSGEVTQGGSTITQQLARGIFLSYEVSMERKLKEMFLALKMEKEYSKDQILEYYINNIYFANGFYGIEAAAHGYFNKSAVELTLSQMMFLCAIPNNPTLYDPLTKMDNTIKRRNRILEQMYEFGEIDEELLVQASNEEIILEKPEKMFNNYEETFIRYSATLELMRMDGFAFKNDFDSDEEQAEYEEKYQEEYNKCNGWLFTGGYKIYTSIDEKMQEKLQKSIDSQLERYMEVDNEGIYSFQGSATCIDNTNGFVVAIVGGRSQDYKGYTLNRAFQSHRQPGSAIKPLLVYTPAFEKGYTPYSYVVDRPIENGPKNAGGGYMGTITVRTAVEKSVNTVAWSLADEMGITNCLKYLKNMNFSRIVNSDKINAASIGGFTYGMSTYEMAAGFSTLENDGIYRNPTCIKKIVDNNGNVILDNGNNTDTQKKIYQSNAARMMTNTLKGVLTSGTGWGYKIDNAICAGKTGTTNDTKDVWFVGYSKYYTTAVWCGYDIPKSIVGDYGKQCAGHIWQDYMQQIHEGKEIVDFVSYYDTIDEHWQHTTEENTTNDANIDIQEEVTTTKKRNEKESSKEETTKKKDKDKDKDNNQNTTQEEIVSTTLPEEETTQQYTTVTAEDGMYTESWN